MATKRNYKNVPEMDPSDLDRFYGKIESMIESARLTKGAQSSLRSPANVGNVDPGQILDIINSFDYNTDSDGQKQHDIDVLNYFKTLDQRKYDRALTLDERQYNSPQSQLARLMALGIGRDAALSLLGSGAGSGSGVQNTAQPIAADASIMPSESALNQNQNVVSSIGAACNITSTLLGLASFGVSLPSVLSQNEIMRNQQYVSGQQNQALQAIGSISNLAGTAIQGGVLMTDNMKDRDSFISAMNGVYSKDPTYQSAMGSLRSNPFGMRYLDDYVNQNFATKQIRPTSEFVDKATRSALSQFYANELNVDALRANISVTKEELKRITQDISQNEMRFSYEMNDLLQGNIQNELQSKLMQQQYEQSESLFTLQQEMSRAQLTAQEQENYIRSWTVKNFEMNGDDYNSASAIELAVKLNTLNAANSDEARLAAFESIVNNKKTSACLSYVNLLSAQGASEFMDSHPEIQSLIGMTENTDWTSLYQLYMQSKGIKSFMKGVPQDLQGQFKEVMRIAGSSGKDPFHLMFDIMY